MPISQLLFSFRGRLNRKPYWLTNLALLVIVALIVVLVAVLGGASAATDPFGLALLPFIVAVVPLAWIGLAVSAKRLHDRGKSAWWLLLFWVLPSVLERVGERIEGFGIIFELASIALTIWALVEMGFLRGIAGPNQYGPDPLAMH
jgi:uncharacterized membrane protein YhaH (DUF805 family)